MRQDTVGRPDGDGDEVARHADRWRVGGWSALVLGIVSAPATGGVSLLGSLGGAAAIAHAGRRREAAREAQARALLRDGRVAVGPAAPWDAAAAGAWLTAVAHGGAAGPAAPGGGTGPRDGGPHGTVR